MRLKVASIVYTSLITLVTGLYLLAVKGIYMWKAAVFPWMAGILTLGLCLSLLATDIKELRTGRYGEEKADGVHMDIASFQDMSMWITYKTAIKNFAWIPAIYAGIWLFGFHIAITLFFIAYLIFRARLRWFLVSSLTLFMLLFLLYFGKFLEVWWPEGILEQWVKIPYWLLH